MTVLAFIPARGGSKRVPSKNLAEVGGVSLVRRAVKCAQTAGVDYVVLSTDSEVVWSRAGPRLWRHSRPADLAGPESQIEDAIAHWMETVDLAADDVIVLLQPTSPFRKPETVRECVRLAREHGAALAVHLSPGVYFGGELTEHDGYLECSWRHSRKTRPRSQDMGWVAESGSVYAFRVDHFRETGNRMKRRAAVVVVPWLQAFEVDTQEDLTVARALVGVADDL